MKFMSVPFIWLCVIPIVSLAHTFTSTASRTDLIELYTSEGCSSCPPAEHKLNSYVDHKRLWIDFVPMAFHVSYWNYLGWHDRFSAAEYSQRQRAYSKQWRKRTVYTPCFVVNGKTTRNPDIPRFSGKPGILQAVLTNGHVQVTFTPAKDQGGTLHAWMAPLSGKETSKITSGENRGRTLEHQFIVLGLTNEPLKNNNGTYTVNIPYARMLNHKALAIWVTQKNSLTPIQATGGWLE